MGRIQKARNKTKEQVRRENTIYEGGHIGTFTAERWSSLTPPLLKCKCYSRERSCHLLSGGLRR